MSETPVYFFLAQVNAIMTGSLRLAMAFALLCLCAWALSLFSERYLPLGRYLTGWLALLGAVGLATAGILRYVLPYANPFVAQGLVFGGLLCCAAVLLLGVQSLKLWQHKLLRGGLVFGGLLLWTWAGWQPAFSRSDKTVLTALMALPVALALAYFPLLFRPELRLPVAAFFHGGWILAMGVTLAIHHGWFYPILAGIPQEGEFYPYINLYDWFLFLFVILYSGNIYVDYWLKQRSSQLALSWNYPIVVVALLCQWLNTNVFDTLAL